MDTNEIHSITSFKTAGEHFGFETTKITHILENMPPTPVPLTKPFVLGIVNNHGNMIPVIDFRTLIGAKPDEENQLTETSIIIVSVDGTNDTLVGFKVDEVEEVFDVTPETVTQTKDVVLEVEKAVQKTLTSTLSYGGKYIYTVDLELLSKVIEQ